jgi:class 3 adenylate cyclase/tetratricopeptide (TPR) repeat protein
VQRCPSCNEENPDKFRMCGFCGTPLQVAPPPEEARKTVTIVFCDLKGSTNLGEKLDSEALREVLAVYFAAMKRVLERHGGTVEKYIGDAIMAVFGLPRMHEDDALRAVRAALDMKEALVEVNGRLHANWGVSLANRTGVNTGEVVAGDASTGQRLATGDTVNVAARLEQAAPESEVLIGESTYRLVRDVVEVNPVPPLDLKGKSDPVPAYQLLAVNEGEAISRRVDLPMVGRESELATGLEVFRSCVSNASCGMLTVVAPAGLGKSRLVAEILHAIGDEARVLRGRCMSYGDGATFLPLAKGVREAAGIEDDDDDDTARRKLELLSGPGREDVAERLASVMGLSQVSFGKDELMWAVRTLFETLSSTQPLVVVFDDIHWAEPTLLDLIEHVVESSSGTPIFLLCAARHELLDERPGWGEGQPNARRIELSELTAADSAMVVQNLLGEAELPAALEARITSVAGGNPLYVEQILSMLVDEGVLRTEEGHLDFAGAPDSLTIPDNINALMASRLDLLPAQQLGVLTRASVIGVEFGRNALTALAPSEEEPTVVPTALVALETKRFVRQRPGAAEIGERRPTDVIAEGDEDARASHEFAHVLVRNVAYDRLLKRNRAGLHERFADWLTDRSGTRLAEFEEIVGYHLEQAYRNLEDLGPITEPGRAVGKRASGHLAAAGWRARGRADMPAAANLLHRASAMLDSDDPSRPRLLLGAGEALTEAGMLEAADRALTEARDTALALGDAELARVARLASLYLRFTTGPESSEGVLKEVETMMLGLEAAGDHGGLARAWRILAYIHWAASRYGQGAQAAESAMEHAAAAGDEVLARSFLGSLASVAVFGPTPVDEAITICESLLDRAHDDRKATGIVLVSLGHLEAMQGNFDRSRQLYRQSRALLEEFGWRLCAALTSLDSADIEVLIGDLEAAEAELRMDFTSLKEMGEGCFIATTAALLADVLYRRGDYDGAERFTEFSRDVASPDDVGAQFGWRCVQAKLLARKGVEEEALREINDAVAIIEASDQLDLQGKGLLDLAEVQGLLGDALGASRSLEEAQGRFELKGNLVLAERTRLQIEAVRSGIETVLA